MNLNQITVPSLNVERAVQFYQLLGLKLIVGPLEHYARLMCPEGESTFSIHLTEELPKGEGVYVYFECENLDDEYERLLSEGVVFEHEPRDQPWLWKEARLKDPDGNQVILYFAGENRINPPWRVKD